jgi:hypothetical protein
MPNDDALHAACCVDKKAEKYYLSRFRFLRGPMLKPKFLPIFGEKNWRFSLQPML